MISHTHSSPSMFYIRHTQEWAREEDAVLTNVLLRRQRSTKNTISHTPGGHSIFSTAVRSRYRYILPRIRKGKRRRRCFQIMRPHVPE